MAEIHHVLGGQQAEGGGSPLPQPPGDDTVPYSSTARCAVPPWVLTHHVESALARDDVAQFTPDTRPKRGRFNIVGGAPSLRRSLKAIKKRLKRGEPVFAINQAAQYLVDNGIVPTAVISLDGLPTVAEMIPIRDDIDYYVASQCSPRLFDALKGRRVILWHAWDSAYDLEEILERSGKPWVTVGGGRTSALRCISLAWLMGYKNIHMYGVDSSYDDAADHHAYEQKYDDHMKLETIKINYGGREFKSSPAFCGQAYDFISQLNNYGHLYRVQVHGKGLLPWISKCINEGVK